MKCFFREKRNYHVEARQVRDVRNARVKELEIRFLYYEECPSHEETLERLRKVLKEERIEADIEVVKVETDEQAKKLRFPGSPTILVNGHDIDPPSKPEYGLSCRAYQLEDGRISPLPSVSMIRRGVRAAVDKNLKRG